MALQHSHIDALNQIVVEARMQVPGTPQVDFDHRSTLLLCTDLSKALVRLTIRSRGLIGFLRPVNGDRETRDLDARGRGRKLDGLREHLDRLGRVMRGLRGELSRNIGPNQDAISVNFPESIPRLPALRRQGLDLVFLQGGPIPLGGITNFPRPSQRDDKRRHCNSDTDLEESSRSPLHGVGQQVHRQQGSKFIGARRLSAESAPNSTICSKEGVSPFHQSGGNPVNIRNTIPWGYLLFTRSCSAPLTGTAV